MLRMVLELANHEGKIDFINARGSRSVRLGIRPDMDAPNLLVAGVAPGGPAKKAGVQKGDIIVELGGKKIEDLNDLRMTLRDMKKGAKTKIKVRRKEGEGEKVLELDIKF